MRSILFQKWNLDVERSILKKKHSESRVRDLLPPRTVIGPTVRRALTSEFKRLQLRTLTEHTAEFVNGRSTVDESQNAQSRTCSLPESRVIFQVGDWRARKKR